MIQLKDGYGAMQKGSHSQIILIDNLTGLSTEMIDMACRWVTGDSDSKRRNYSDDDDIIYAFKRQLLINGINRPANRPDFLDRCLLVEMNRIPDTQRKTDEEIAALFKQHHGEWLGAIFTLLAKAMAIKPTLKLKQRSRLADWEEYAIAITIGAGGTEETYFKDRAIINERQQQAVFDASPVAQAIVSFMNNKNRWEGTATELLKGLNIEAGNLSLNYSKEWPKAPNSLALHFSHLVPTLASYRINLLYGDETRTKHGRLVILTKN
jgi:hypothetical protein